MEQPLATLMLGKCEILRSSRQNTAIGLKLHYFSDPLKCENATKFRLFSAG